MVMESIAAFSGTEKSEGAADEAVLIEVLSYIGWNRV